MCLCAVQEMKIFFRIKGIIHRTRMTYYYLFPSLHFTVNTAQLYFQYTLKVNWEMTGYNTVLVWFG